MWEDMSIAELGINFIILGIYNFGPKVKRKPWFGPGVKNELEKNLQSEEQEQFS